jgi:hypothetical protein
MTTGKVPDEHTVRTSGNPACVCGSNCSGANWKNETSIHRDGPSFYSRQSIDHPETLSGLWEASDGHGGTIGIHLLMMTVVPLHTDPPIWSPQSSVSLDVSV